MKKLSLTLVGLFVFISLFAQKKQVVNVSTNITSNTTWTANNIYLLSGIVRVVDGVTLTIEPGTVVKGGAAPDQSNATCLLIDRGAKIYAVGTKEKPIVFTSAQPKGERDYGDWGGIVIFGKAPVNKANPQYEGGVIPGNYGGTDVADSSGVLKYCRIEFAGYPFEQDRELNSLTMCGVGNKTLIEYVQCSYNNDDAFEWFGGTVNAKHLIAYRTNDDDWDVDQGFSGKVQFGVSLADLNVADISTKNGFEVDNDAGGTNDGPKTSATFSNMTTIGAYQLTTDTRDALHGRGAHIRRNNEVSIFNSIFMGWKEGIRMDGTNTFSNFQNNLAYLQNNLLAGNVINYNGAGSVVAADFQAWFEADSNYNRKLTTNADLKLANPYNYGNPDFKPTSGSPALSGASFANTKLTGGFFTTTTYVGAFAENDTWADVWTEFDPNNKEYDDMPTGLNDVEVVASLSVYPNPAATTVNVSFELLTAQKVNVVITDITGKVVMMPTVGQSLSTGLHHISTDVSSLNNGIYLVQIQTSNGVKTSKICISK
jgi:hypothetical protein